jgi:hypothetical protein
VREQAKHFFLEYGRVSDSEAFLIFALTRSRRRQRRGRRTAGLNSGARHHHGSILAGGGLQHILASSYPSIHTLLGGSLHCTKPPLPIFSLATAHSLYLSISTSSRAGVVPLSIEMWKGRKAVDREREKRRESGTQAINGSLGTRRLMAAWQVLSVASPS